MGEAYSSTGRAEGQMGPKLAQHIEQKRKCQSRRQQRGGSDAGWAAGTRQRWQ